jgi:hypothetical protein
MRRILPAAVFLAFAAPSHAGTPEFDISCAVGASIPVCQDAFAGVMEDVSAALNYKALGPAEASGITGIALYAVGSYVPTQNKADWRLLTGKDVDQVGMAGVSVRKGLPFDIDVGAFYTAVPGSGASLYGAELRYAILAGGVASPALAVRGTYTRSAGIDDFDYSAWSADASISKGFTLLTPYVGAGVVRSTADPDASTGLQRVKTNGTRVFAGLRIGLGFFDIVPEYEHIGGNNAYNLALGFSF